MSMWSDYGAPVQRRWWKSPKRSTRSSTGLKILLAAGVVVAGVIGISGVYPQVIDAEWVQGARTYASRTPAPDAKMTRRSDIPASVQPLRIAPTTSEAAVATPRPAAVVPTPRAAAAASKPLPVETELPALAEIPDASANADAPPNPASTVAAKPASPVVKRRVTRVERPRRAAPGAFAFGWGGSPFRM
jgi:hypothetical protein